MSRSVLHDHVNGNAGKSRKKKRCYLVRNYDTDPVILAPTDAGPSSTVRSRHAPPAWRTQWKSNPLSLLSQRDCNRLFIDSAVWQLRVLESRAVPETRRLRLALLASIETLAALDVAVSSLSEEELLGTTGMTAESLEILQRFIE